MAFTIIGISQPMSFDGDNGQKVNGYRVDVAEPHEDSNAFGLRTEHGFIMLNNMKPEYFEFAKAGTAVIPLRSRRGKINGFIPA